MRIEENGFCPDCDATTITLVIWRGVLDDVIGLPDGWAYVLRDHDVDYDSWPDADERCVRIEVEGGMVTNVENLPEGYDLVVKDHDDEDYEDEPSPVDVDLDGIRVDGKEDITTVGEEEE